MKSKKVVGRILLSALVLLFMLAMWMLVINNKELQLIAETEKEEKAAYSSGSNFNYEVISETNKTIRLIGYTGTATEVAIPSTINGYTVTELYKTFQKIKSIGSDGEGTTTLLTRISIPSTVKVIEYILNYDQTQINNIVVDTNNEKFSSVNGVLFNKDQTKLVKYPRGKTNTSYIIPSTVIEIGENAFYFCDKLTTITIANSVKIIGHEGFYGCLNLTNVVMGNSVEEIKSEGFLQCESLTSIELPDSLISIGSGAFRLCESLITLRIPKSVTYIGTGIATRSPKFESITVDSGNMNFISDQGILFDKEKTTIMVYPQGKKDLTTYTIPNTVNTIYGYAFYDCRSLSNLYIPNSVTNIGEWAFCDSKFDYLELPESLTNIGYVAFTGINVPKMIIPSSVTQMSNQTFQQCYMEEAEIYSKTVSECCFLWCSNLKKIIIGEDTEKINKRAFEGCHKLSSIVIFNPEIEITDGAIDRSNGNTTIYCYQNSTAQAYAERYDINYVFLESIPAIEVKNNPELYYGKKVNYSANGIDDWKVFYADDDNIFLIAGDYLPVEKVPTTATGLTTSGTYNAYWKTVPTAQTVTPLNKSFMFEGWSDYSTYENGKCVSTLLNTENWTSFVNTDYADYSIGGPTLEMWIASWNAVYPSDLLYCNNTNDYGYCVGTANKPTNFRIDSNVMKAKSGYSNTLYYPHRDKLYGCYGYLLASQSSGNDSDVVDVWYDGWVYRPELSL